MAKTKTKNIIKQVLIKNQEGKHSFLYWLMIPVILTWISVSYIVGFIKDNPKWETTSQNTSVGAKPYFNDYEQLTKADLANGLISIWFDDAWLSQYMVAYPILKDYGFVASIAVPVNAIETPNYMNWAQLQTLQKSGWEISNHSLSHDCDMQSWSQEQIAHELLSAKMTLWKNKLSSDIFVTPCGVDSETLKNEAEKLFLAYRTVDPGINETSNVNFYELKVRNIDAETTFENVQEWINEAKGGNRWVILIFHKVGEKIPNSSDELFNTPKQDFANIIEYIKFSNLKVVVPSQVIMSITI